MTMEDKRDNKTVSKIEELVKLFYSVVLVNSQFSKDEILGCFGSLLYARKKGVLMIVPKGRHLTGAFLKLCSSEKENKIVCVDILRNEQSTKNQKFLILLNQFYESLVFKTNSSFIYELCQFIVGTNFEECEYLEVYDNMLQICGIDKMITIPQSDELVELISSFLEDKTKSVFDPFGGLMTLESKLKCQRFVAFEENYSLWVKGFFRLALAGKLDSVESNFGKATEMKSGKFDAIASIPTIGIRRPDVNMNNDVQVLNSFEDFTHGGGKLVAVIPSVTAISNATKYVELRAKFIQKNYLDCLIQLPKGLYGTTNVGTVLVVLKKNRKENAPIRIIDATNFLMQGQGKNVMDVAAIINCYKGDDGDCSMSVDNLTMLNNNSSWMVKWYLFEKNQKFTEGYVVKRFNELLEEVKGAFYFDEKFGNIVKSNNLEIGAINYEKKPEAFEMSGRLENVVKITEPVILVSKLLAVKPVLCNASIDHPIFIESPVIAYRVKNEKVHKGYLCVELEKRLKEFNDVVGFWGVDLLGKTSLEFPSLDNEHSYDEQKKLFELAQSAARVERAKRMGLESLLEQKKKEYIEEVRHRKHDMKTPMSQLRNTLTLLESLVPQITGEPAEKLKIYVQRQKKAMDTLSEIVSHIADEDVFTSPEPVDLDVELSSAQQKTERYVVTYYSDKTAFAEAGISKPMVNMGRADLLRLIQNIIENAINHGFIGNNSEYSLNITLTIDKGFYVIDFSNNGEPLPEGLTKSRYGMKGSPGKGSKGTGAGGYIVKSITEHYGGDYDVYSKRFAGVWFTHVIVKLPIYHDNE